MTTSASARPPSRPCPRERRHWSRAALRHFIRGLSYGTGLTLAGLAGYWIRPML